jgi:alpha-D-xyloside xylohydrolase
MESRLHAPKADEKVNLEIRHYGKADGAYRLYDDDGETFNYENGMYSWRDIKVTRDRKGQLKGTVSKAGKGKPDNIANVSWKFMTEQ